MARILSGGIDHFNEMVYGATHAAMPTFIQQINHSVSNVLTEAGRAFAQSVHEIYKAVDLSDVTRRVKAAGRRLSAVFADNTVRQLHTIEDFQMAPMIMRRWLMAEPTIRTLYHDQGCAGYGDTYIDVQPGLVGVEHYDYRRVTDGVTSYSDESTGSAGFRSYTNYHEHVADIDVLMAEDRIDIMTSWVKQRQYILDRGRDPSDEWDHDL